MKAVVVLALCLAEVASAQPAKAVEHHKRGLDLLKRQKDYKGAAREFQAAYEVDKDPKYLFNLALAQRLDGDCRAAIETYRAYLATDPPEVNATNANIGIARCEEALASTTRPDPPRTDDAASTTTVTTSSPDRPPSEPDHTPPTTPTDARPGDAPQSPPTAPTAHDRPRRRDALGTWLIVGSGATGVLGVSLYVLARQAASATHSPSSLADFEHDRDRAHTLETASWISAGVAVALAAGGVIRFVTRDEPRADVTVAPTTGSGAAVLVGGRF